MGGGGWGGGVGGGWVGVGGWGWGSCLVEAVKGRLQISYRIEDARRDLIRVGGIREAYRNISAQ